jgi:hypothetical protein
MSQVELINTAASSATYATDADAIHINDLPTEQRTNEIAVEAIKGTEIPSASDEITNSVTADFSSPTTEEIEQLAMLARIIEETNPLDTMNEIEEHVAKELSVAKLNDDKPKVNYLTQISQLISDISALLQQWTARDNARIETKKTEYGDASTEIQENHISKGNWNMILGGVGAAIGLYPATQGLAGPFSNLVQALNSRLDANATEPSQKNQLRLQDLQKMSESSSSNNAMRDQALQILNEVKQWAQTAARHG